MTDYDNTNSLALFKNDRMREGKQDAPYRGKGETTCAACGQVTAFWADMWRNAMKSKPGEFVLNVRLTPKESAPPPGDTGAGDDDLIPF